MEFGRFFGFLHPALVHFPLSLILVSVLIEAFGFFRRERRFTWMALILLLLGTVSMLFAFVAGNFAELWAARYGVPQEPMETHELLATITSWLFVFLTAWRMTLGVDGKRRQIGLYLAFAAVGCVLLGITGHRGAMLVYEHGAGVQAAGPPPVPTHEDLLQLIQKQDADDIFYSNKMHHIFGWLVLILSAMLMVDNVSPKMGDRLRQVGPILLLLGGAYLMVFSDTDSWPLSHIRPVTDKEVLVHKTYATLMMLIGLRGIWRFRSKVPEGRQMQNRTMAIFALVGGAMLFTHVHSGAAYANVAVGVYVHHTVMGFIALSIGAVKLLEDALPKESPLRRRGFVWAYPSLMFLEAILLVSYNEGLPWFLGYGEMSVSAPHKGLLAHLGPDRAELAFDRNTGRLDFYVLGKQDDTPRPIPASLVQAVVKVGTESTLVPLQAVAEPTGNAHFTGSAAFLATVPLFQAQVLVPRPGQTTWRSALIADFEPVVDPSKANPQHTKAAYLCPMHEDVGSASPGKCDRCGMNLVPNKPPRLANQLHDDGYKMDLALQQSGNTVDQPQSGQPLRLTFTPRRADGNVVKDLDIVHTKKLHLIIASRDLSFFDHVHPEPQPDGTLILENYAFPQPGEYLLYADLTPTGDRNQVFRLPVSVAGPPPAPQSLEITPTQAKLFGDYRVSLALAPTPIVVKDETHLTFTLTENGIPVNDLEPFLGAGGHCVILSEDTENYLHSHPLETKAARFGPDITFHTVFPKPGRYKVWGQFQHRGKPITADFVIEVR